MTTNAEMGIGPNNTGIPHDHPALQAFTIEPNHISMNGTGRPCHSVQGWTMRPVDRRVKSWGYCTSNRDGEWFGARKDARASAVERYYRAHEEDPEVVADMREDYIQWLLMVWPDAPVALKALEIQTERKRVENERNAADRTQKLQQDRLKRAAPDLFAAAGKLLRNATVTPVNTVVSTALLNELRVAYLTAGGQLP